MRSKITSVPFSQATGSVSYNMTNDYLFHIVLQKNEKALIGLIASLLHLDPKFIKHAVVQNPIKISDVVTGKLFFLDILVHFDNSSINMEMQIRDLQNWIPRSLSYLCREYDNLNRGDDYNSVKPVYQIGFLDYTLFPEHPEFYATYRICNLKTHQVYSDSLTLSVIELNHIDLATEEDRKYGIDKWASLFKATTWEEIRMLAANDPYIESAAETIYNSVTDPTTLMILQRRQEEMDADTRRRERLIEQEKLLAERDEQIDVMSKENSRLRKLLEKNGISAE